MNGEYQIDEPKKGLKYIVLLVTTLFVVISLTFVIYFFTKINKPISFENAPINFVINRGETTKQIANQLTSKKIINNQFIFKLYVLLHRASAKIQAGPYLLNRNMSITEIVDVLTKGKVVYQERNITIIEGWSNKQISQYLASREIATVEEFDTAIKQINYDFKFKKEAEDFSAKGKSAPGGDYQGFLFPDTYRLNKDASVGDLIIKMLMNFENKITDETLTSLQKKNLKLTDVMILASIIEKEVGRNKEILEPKDLEDLQNERELVASVFYNRLKRQMPLESDATINYITGKSDRSVTLADTKINSLYNTYQNIGLPPTPICNPGLGSILAAVNPATSDYLYFLNKPNGEAVFAKTLSEHNINKAKYLK